MYVVFGISFGFAENINLYKGDGIRCIRPVVED